MRRAILFRYHKRTDVCLNRIQLLRRFNPGMAIYGIYGGPYSSPPSLPLNHNYALPFTSARYKWQNGDLCTAQWFRDVGHRFSFDMLHIIEWDLILLKPVSELLRHVTDGIGVTDVRTIEQMRCRNWYWIKTPTRNADLEDLRSFVSKKYGKKFNDQNQLAGGFGGASLSRPFLERFAEVGTFTRPFLNDEIRMTLLAQTFGMNVHDAGLHKNNPYWDCYKRRVPYSLLKTGDTKCPVLHHVRGKIDFKVPPA